MKRNDLIQKIGTASRSRGLPWHLVREGRNHEVWTCGGQRVIVLRHREINENTARGICKDLQEQLGENWWNA